MPHGEIFLEVKVAWDIGQIVDAGPVPNAQIEDVSVVK
jgi:hypothetical protein